jgi:hypothetical protein
MTRKLTEGIKKDQKVSKGITVLSQDGFCGKVIALRARQ